MSINRQIGLTLLLLIVAILFFGISGIDIEVQNIFFNENRQEWILDKNLEPYRFIFYDGIKKLLIAVALSFLLAILFFRKNPTIQEYKKGIIVVILSAILVPLIVGGLKKATNMPCPKNEIHYGGVYPATKVWEHYPKSFHQPSSIKCFPAGHASGGFALLSLFFLFKTNRNRRIALLSALTVGWSMGLYKMLIGDHFLSHTIITMILAWLIVLLLHKFIQFKPNKGTINTQISH